MTLIAVVWANTANESYHHFWDLKLEFRGGSIHMETSLHSLTNDLLMSVFFFTVGLEVRREFAIGELTSWSRALVPVVAAVAGLCVPAIVFVLFNLGSSELHAWAIVISTDTAFLVGALALVGPRKAPRLRVFLLALAVVDDIGALTVIALAYTETFTPAPLVVAAAGLVGIYFVRRLRQGRGFLYTVLALTVWAAFYSSGVHPTLAGVAVALLIPVYLPNRRDVEHALQLANVFGQSPNTRYARAAVNSLRESISINERLQQSFDPYIAFAILPVFALANAGVQLSGEIMGDALRSSVTWGIIAALVGGKFIGIFGATLLLKTLRIGDFGIGLSSGRIAGGALLSGIGFTISLFIIDLALDDESTQNEARVGVLVASLLAFVLGAAYFRLSEKRRADGEIGRSLVRPVDPSRDHISGPLEAPLTIVEYGDFQCPFCSKASGSIDEVLLELGDTVRYVWRHAPQVNIHPNALAAAEAAEAAARQGKFLEFTHSLFADQERQLPPDILYRAQQLKLDLVQFESDLTSPVVITRVLDDVLDAAAMDITSVPTFFINGARHTGPYDAQTLLRKLTGIREGLERSDTRSEPTKLRPFYQDVDVSGVCREN